MSDKMFQYMIVTDDSDIIGDGNTIEGAVAGATQELENYAEPDRPTTVFLFKQVAQYKVDNTIQLRTTSVPKAR